ncbi:hypothetical protein DFP73DRAFT_596251 [Morchella snyderi]|nr:hypothetical protein DFP73DRAFT_596251 [Morchella snyderi]
MSRPGPKPSIESTLNERVHLHEQMIRLLFNGLTRPPKGNSTGEALLRRLEELNARTDRHCCSVCNKPYSDAKGLWRHILKSTSEDHEQLQRAYKALCWSLCGHISFKREQVTKHESTCRKTASEEESGNAGPQRLHPILSNTISPYPPEEEFGNARLRQLPPIMGRDPASPYTTYFSRADLM